MHSESERGWLVRIERRSARQAVASQAACRQAHNVAVAPPADEPSALRLSIIL